MDPSTKTADIQERLDAPMPWIGMYIAAASTICTLAMAADVFAGFKSKKLWIPCKYFSLNAASLTLLAITIKLTVDLTSIMAGLNDQIAVLSSLLMMSTAISHFMISMASMELNEIILNLVALSILVITVIVNVTIRSIGVPDRLFMRENKSALFFMAIMTIVCYCSAILVQTIKRNIERRYSEVDKIVSSELVPSICELRVILKKYCVMAETGSLQFVMARSMASAYSGLMCLLAALTLVEAYIRVYGFYIERDLLKSGSIYKWSINWILFIQTGGVAVGTIAPVFRWFLAVRFRCSNKRSLKEESSNVEELDFSQYVVLLEGEPEFPNKTITNICKQVDKLIDTGKRQKPKNIFHLLQKSENFNGVKEFNNDEVKSLHFEKYPQNCWSLSIVTLTNIAMALPNISYDSVDQLLTAVDEGLPFVKHIERTTDINRELLSIRKAADVVWARLKLYHKWQNNDILAHPTQTNRTYKHALQDLSNIAEKNVLDFTNDPFTENPVNWPTDIIAASSMHQICETLLQAQNDCIHQTEEGMFEKITIIISDILAACFTNLSRSITLKCKGKANKERVESVRQTAVLLGKSFEIIELLEQRQLPNLDPEKAVYIDEWRAFMKQDDEDPFVSASASTLSGESMSIELVVLERRRSI